MTLNPVGLPHINAMKPGAPPQASMIQKGVVSGAHNTGLCVDNESNGVPSFNTMNGGY